MEIRFIDLFSGIGGFRLGLERCNDRRLERASPKFKHVWSNDFNKYANQIYIKNFGTEGHHAGDVRGVDTEDIPDFDLLCAGFPCQSFSVAGKRKGFEDTRGTLFFEICRIAEHHRPRMLLLENVAGLLYHDRGKTLAIILKSLEALGYWWEYQVLNSKHFGVPQNRERVFIIGHLRDGGGREIFPITEAKQMAIGEVTGEGEQSQCSNAIDANYWKGPDKHGQRTVVAVELAHRGSNMKNGRFSEISHALDGGGSKGVIQVNQRKEVVAKDHSGTVHESMSSRQAPKVVVPINFEHKAGDGSKTRKRKLQDIVPALQAKAGHTQQSYVTSPKVIDVRQSRREGDPLRVFEDKSPTLTANMHKEPPVVYDMKQIYRENKLREYNGISPTISTPSGGQRIPMVYWKNSKEKVVQEDREDSPSLKTQSDLVRQPLVVADRSRTYRGGGRELESPKEISNSITSVQKDNYLLEDMTLRRFTPLECERLQGFPDNWTKYGYEKGSVLDTEPIYGWREITTEPDGDIERRLVKTGKKPIPPLQDTVAISDTQRYRCLGNAITTNVVEFLGYEILEKFLNIRVTKKYSWVTV